MWDTDAWQARLSVALDASRVPAIATAKDFEPSHFVTEREAITMGAIPAAYPEHTACLVGRPRLALVLVLLILRCANCQYAGLAGGQLHACGLTDLGGAYCWGNNDNGQIGDGTNGTNRLAPVVVSGGYNFSSISSGNFHTCGLAASGGAAYCWGWNDYGQIGDGTSGTNRLVPVMVSGGYNFSCLTAGYFHTCGLVASGGAAYCWGRDNYGQIGNGTSGTNRVAPAAVSGGYRYSSVTSGLYHTCGVVASGGVTYCWGHNNCGQIGDGTIGTDRLVPVVVSGSRNFSFLTAGDTHTCGLVASGGAAYCWGYNGNGQIGDGTSGTNRLVPVAVSGGRNYSSISSGFFHTCGLVASGGAAYCWGKNDYGQIGDGTIGVYRLVPVGVSGGRSFSNISAAYANTCGLAATGGAAYCWGGNNYGQIGDGTSGTNRLSPVSVIIFSSTPSLTQSVSSGGTASRSLSLTRSQSQSAFQTQTFSQSQSASMTQVQTRSSTETVTRSSSVPSLSATASNSDTRVLSASSKLTLSRSQTQTQDATSSQWQTLTQSRSSKLTSSPTQTQSPSFTPTPTVSRPPLMLLFAASVNDVPSPISAQALQLLGGANVSDSVTPTTSALWLNRCPNAGDAELDRFVVECLLAMPPVNLHPSLFISVDTTSTTISCDPASSSSVQLPFDVTVGAVFATAGGAEILTCRLTDSSSPSELLAITSLSLKVAATLWPLWDDAILVTANGLMRSARISATVDAASDLRHAAVTYASVDTEAALAAVTFMNATQHGSIALFLEAALASPAIVLAVAKKLWENATLLDPGNAINSTRTTAIPTFAMTLSGASRIVLRRASSQRAFAPNLTIATLGGVACNVSAVSDDGAWAVLDMPEALAVCGTWSASVDCGYITFTLSNGPSMDDSGNAIVHGASLSCPPFCPGVVGGGVVPLPLSIANTMATGGNDDSSDSGTSFALGFDPPSARIGKQGALPVFLPRTSSLTSEGFYYAAACADTGLWTDPLGGACTNASDPASSNCAYGSGIGCVPCPTSALCPGGSRLWPRVGFWAAFDTTGGVTPCAGPDPASRCMGWSVALGATLCGAGYLQGSSLCGACAPGYFLQDDGTCNACPVLKSAWDRYHTLLYILIIVAGIVALVWVGLLLLVRLRGGTLLGGAKRMLDLFVWGMLSAQVVSSAAIVSSPSLPPLLASLYRAAAVLQLQGVLFAPACTGAYPFQSEVSLMGVALGAWSLCLVVYYTRRMLARVGCLNKAVLLLGRAALVLSLVLYSSSSSSAVSLLNCYSLSVTAGSLATLDGGAITAPATASASAASVSAAAAATGHSTTGTTAAIQVLVQNPFFVCWAGSHRAAGILAAVTLVLYVTALPATLLGWAWTDPWLRTQLRALVQTRRAESTHGRSRDKEDGAGGELVLVNPLRTLRHGYPHHHQQQQQQQQQPDALLQPVLGDYVPSAWYTKLVDVLLLLALSLIRALVPQPTTLSLITAKAAVSCTLLLAVCVHVMLVRTFVPQQAWKSWVRALLLFDSAGCALLNAAVSALVAGLGGQRLAVSISVGSYILFFLCCITLGVLLWQFGSSVYAGAEAEQRDLVEAKAVQASPSAAIPTITPHSALSVHPTDGATVTLEQPLSTSVATPAQAMRMAVNPIQSRTRSRRGISRSRSLARFSDALRNAGDQPEAARVACIALRDALSLRLARGSMRSTIATRVSVSVSMTTNVGMRKGVQSVPEPGSTTACAPVSPPAPAPQAAAMTRASVPDKEDITSAVGALADALVLHAANAAIVEAACEGLQSAITCNSAAIRALIATGVPRGLLAARRTHGAASDGISRAACGVLTAVALSSGGAEAIVDAGGVDFLAALLHTSLAVAAGRRGEGEGVGETASETCKLLAELAAHEDAVYMLADSGAIEDLADVLVAAAAALVNRANAASSSSNVTAASYAAKTVAAITLDDDALARFTAAGGVAPLVSLLQVWLTRMHRPAVDAASAALLQASTTEMATHVCEAMLSLSTRANGAASLFDAGAIPVLLEAISVANTASATDSVNALRKSWALWEAACWALRGFSRDRRQLCTLAASDAAASVTALLAVCEDATTAAPLSGGAYSEAEAACRVAEHARALLSALAAAQCGH